MPPTSLCKKISCLCVMTNKLYSKLTINNLGKLGACIVGNFRWRKCHEGHRLESGNIFTLIVIEFATEVEYEYLMLC